MTSLKPNLFNVDSKDSWREIQDDSRTKLTKMSGQRLFVPLFVKNVEMFPNLHEY